MEGDRHALWPGIPLAVGAAVLFGASTPFAKLLLGEVSPWLLAGLLYLGSGLGLAFIGGIRRRLGVASEAPLRRADLPWLAAAVTAGGILAPVLLMVGLLTTPAASVSLLLNLEGVFTLGLAWIVFRENVDLRVGIGAAAILLGALVLSLPEGSGEVGWGIAAVAAACLAWAIDNNLTRKIAAADPLQIATIKGLVAGAVNVAIGIALARGWPSLPVLAAAGLVGLLGYGVSLMMFVLALRHLGAARTGAYFSLAPFVGAGLAISAFGEPLTGTFLVAGLLMAIGLWLHLTERHDHEHAHEPMVHEHRHVHDEHHQHRHAPSDPFGEPHVHVHEHPRLVHRHPHYPDIHHRHEH
jgi:drug/metabolite transporter (DMT)-like permease